MQQYFPRPRLAHAQNVSEPHVPGLPLLKNWCFGNMIEVGIELCTNEVALASICEISVKGNGTHHLILPVFVRDTARRALRMYVGLGCLGMERRGGIYQEAEISSRCFSYTLVGSTNSNLQLKLFKRFAVFFRSDEGENKFSQNLFALDVQLDDYCWRLGTEKGSGNTYAFLVSHHQYLEVIHLLSPFIDTVSLFTITLSGKNNSRLPDPHPLNFVTSCKDTPGSSSSYVVAPLERKVQNVVQSPYVECTCRSCWFK